MNTKIPEVGDLWRGRIFTEVQLLVVEVLPDFRKAKGGTVRAKVVFDDGKIEEQPLDYILDSFSTYYTFVADGV